MYLQTRFQSVYDVAARVSPLLTKQGEEDKARDVNLMHSRLRAVSRTHLEYLRLMGVVVLFLLFLYMHPLTQYTQESINVRGHSCGW